ncbi:MAG: EamA family transporter [Armatimonadetes bacterium]|nr:EamA family transporter [Armatimonadota bacterium]
MRWRGYAAVLTAAALWGISGVVAKSLFSGRVDPLALVEIRLTAAFALTLAIFWIRRRPVRLPRAEVLRLLPLGAAMVLAQSTYYLTISLADVATAIFLQYTAPALVVAYGMALHRERLTAIQALSVSGTIGGAYLLVVGPGGLAVTPAALATGIASAFGFAAWVLVGRSRARTTGSWEMLLYALGTGAVLWSLLVPPWQAYLRPYSAAEWGMIAFIVVAASLVPFGLFLYGLRFIDSRAASLTATIEPVVATAVAAALIGETLTGRGIAGAAIILASVILLQVMPEVSARQT